MTKQPDALFSESEMPRNEQLAVVQPTPISLIAKLIDAGDLTADKVGIMERLVTMDREMRKDHAEREFNAAFNALQAEMPSVIADREVPDKQGNLKYKFAAFEDIMAQVKPLLLKNGFSLSFSMDFREGRVIQQCTLSHSGGHSRSNTFMARPGSGPPGSSEAQGDGAASTYAKRFALCNALNIIVERDTDGADARKEGSPVTEDQALWLEDMVKQTKSDKAAFLKYAGAPDFATIGSERFEALSRSLNKKLAGL